MPGASNFGFDTLPFLTEAGVGPGCCSASHSCSTEGFGQYSTEQLGRLMALPGQAPSLDVSVQVPVQLAANFGSLQALCLHGSHCYRTIEWFELEGSF